MAESTRRKGCGENVADQSMGDPRRLNRSRWHRLSRSHRLRRRPYGVPDARLVLTELWASEAGDTVTANELMELTGLTRATVLAVCDDLVRLGWLQESSGVAAVTTGATAGRPPRRFSFCAGAGYVVGVDVGDASIRVAVADLRGGIIGRARRQAGFAADQGAEREVAIRQVIAAALADAEIPASSVRVISFGLAAPVRPSGGTPAAARGTYWSRMQLDPSAVLAGRPDWQHWLVLVDDDANLAALAAGAHGEAVRTAITWCCCPESGSAPASSPAAVVLGRDGGAGDLHFLELISGVGDQKGLAATARRLWTATPGAASSLPPVSRRRAQGTWRRPRPYARWPIASRGSWLRWPAC